VRRDTYSSGTLYLYRDSVNPSEGTAIASASLSRSTFPAATDLKVVKADTSIKIYVKNNSGSYVEKISVTNNVYSSGKIGFGYPANWTSNTEFTFGSITDNSVVIRPQTWAMG
jgi:hypothetical protein